MSAWSRMLRWILLLMLLATFGTPSAGAEPPAIAGGWVLIEGRYVPPPYRVTLDGTRLRLNGHLVSTFELPGEAPPGPAELASLYDPATLDLRDSLVVPLAAAQLEAWRAEVGQEEAVARLEAWLRQQPVVARLEIEGDMAIVYDRNGDREGIWLGDESLPRRTQAALDVEAAARRDELQDWLQQGGGFLLFGDGTQTYVPPAMADAWLQRTQAVLTSDRPAAEKRDLLRDQYPAPAMLADLLANYEAVPGVPQTMPPWPVGGALAAPDSPAANETPNQTNFVIMNTMVFDIDRGGDQILKKLARHQNYSLTVHENVTADDGNPEGATFANFAASSGAAILLMNSHGGQDDLVIEAYGRRLEDRIDRLLAYIDLLSAGYKSNELLLMTINRYYVIAITGQGIQNHWNDNKSIVFMGACDSLGLQGDFAPREYFGYSDTCTGNDVDGDATLLFNRMDGRRDNVASDGVLRPATAAFNAGGYSTKFSHVSRSGATDTTISPGVVHHSPEGVFLVPVLVPGQSVGLDTEVDVSIPPADVVKIFGCQGRLLNQTWVGDDAIMYDVELNVPGRATMTVRNNKAISDNNKRQLDGNTNPGGINRTGPNRDDFRWDRIYCIWQSWIFPPIDTTPPYTTPPTYRYYRWAGKYVPSTGLVYLPGGYMADGTLDGEIIVFDPTPPSPTFWGSGTSLPSAVADYVLGLLQDDGGEALYIVGGSDFEMMPTPTVQRVGLPDLEPSLVDEDPYLLLIGEGQALPGGSAVVDNLLYVFGGSNAAFPPYVTGEMQIFDPLAPAGQRWTDGQPLNEPRGDIAGAAVDGKIYAIGGYVYSEEPLPYPSPTVEVFDPAVGAWQLLAPLPVPCGAAQAYGLDSDLEADLAGHIVVAGCGQGETETEQTFLYDVDSDTWTDFSFFQEARQEHAGTMAATDDGLVLLAFGGLAHTGILQSAVGSYEAMGLTYTPPPDYGPFAGFDVEITGLQASFLNTTTGSEPITYLWDLGDGTVTDEISPTHVYDSFGAYTVTLTATHLLTTSVASGTVKLNPPAVGLWLQAGDAGELEPFYAQVGDVVNISYRVQNLSSSVYLSDLAVTDSRAGLVCTIAGPLAHLEEETCTRSHAVTGPAIMYGAVSGEPTDQQGTSLGLDPVSAGATVAIVVEDDAVCPNELINGDFESGPGSGWLEQSSAGAELIVTAPDLPIPPHGGAWAAMLGGEVNRTDLMTQTLAIPQGKEPVALSFWARMDTEDASLYNEDWLYASVNGDVVQDLLTTSPAGTWQHHTVSLTDYAGETVSLVFYAQNDGSAPTTFYLDDVRLNACTPPWRTYLPLVVKD